MNSRLRSIADAIESVIDACRPVLRPWKVRFMQKVPHETQPGMVVGKWTTERVDAYNREHAAQQIGEKYNLKLRPSYNCWVTRVMPGEVDENDA